MDTARRPRSYDHGSLDDAFERLPTLPDLPVKRHPAFSTSDASMAIAEKTFSECDAFERLGRPLDETVTAPAIRLDEVAHV